jgi:2'-hydroxyisoflavone reductase
MDLLIIGGTRFLGRHLAEQALAAGHRVTLLNRGRSGPGLFPEAEHLVADRDRDLSVLAGRQWDAALDTCAYFPRQVRSLAGQLAGRVGQYQLVSSISAYAGFAHPGIDEDSPVIHLDDTESPTTITGDNYGGLKVACEQAAFDGFGEACVVARPGLIVGPHDPTGRWTWWVQRLLRGGDVLAPGDPATPVQFIDARDIAAWMLHQAAQAHQGVFNLNGPDTPLTMGDWLAGMHAALASHAHFTWVDEAFVLGQGVQPWSDLPVWLPRENAAMHEVDCSRARDSGLVCRPFAQTAQDTAAWLAAAPAAPPAGGPPRPAVGLAPDREAALLAAWHEDQTAK